MRDRSRSPESGRGGALVSAKVRLDVLLVERGLFESRARAAAAVLAGEVLLLPGRARALKPGQMVAHEAELEVAAARSSSRAAA